MGFPQAWRDERPPGRPCAAPAQLRILVLEFFEFSRPSSASLALSSSSAASAADVDDEWATIWQRHLIEVRSVHFIESGPPAALPLVLAHAKSVTLARLQCRTFDAGERALFIEGVRALSSLCPLMSIDLSVGR